MPNRVHSLMFASQLKLSEQSHLRRRIIKGILSTDMLGHFDQVKQLDQFIAQAQASDAPSAASSPRIPAPITIPSRQSSSESTGSSSSGGSAATSPSAAEAQHSPTMPATGPSLERINTTREARGSRASIASVADVAGTSPSRRRPSASPNSQRPDSSSPKYGTLSLKKRRNRSMSTPADPEPRDAESKSAQKEKLMARSVTMPPSLFAEAKNQAAALAAAEAAQALAASVAADSKSGSAAQQPTSGTQQAAPDVLLRADYENKTPAEVDKTRQFLFDLLCHASDLQSVVVPNSVAAVSSLAHCSRCWRR